MIIDRRGFLAGLGLMAGGVLIEKAVPLGRVYSFPKKILIAQNLNGIAYVEMVTRTPETRVDGSLSLIPQDYKGIWTVYRENVQIFDRHEFYTDPCCFPIKTTVRYGTGQELNSSIIRLSTS